MAASQDETLVEMAFRREDRVKFPSHPKRMTTTPNQGPRWVKREIAWKLFDS